MVRGVPGEHVPDRNVGPQSNSTPSGDGDGSDPMSPVWVISVIAVVIAVVIAWRELERRR